MWINLRIFKIRPEQIDEFRAVLYSRPECSPGGHFAWLMQNDDSPADVISMTVWDNKEAAAATYSAPDVAEILAKIKPFLAAQPQKAGYTLVGERQCQPGVAKWVNLTSMKIKPEQLNEFKAALYSRPECAPGGRYGWLLQNDDNPAEVISLTAWESKGAAMAMFTNPDYAAILTKIKPFVTSPGQKGGYTVVFERLCQA